MRRTAFLILVVVLSGLMGFAEPVARKSLHPQEPQSPPVKSIRVNGAELSYVEQGRGQPVILIHGFLHDYRGWAETWPALAKHYRVIAYSRRYHYPNRWPGHAPENSLPTELTDAADLVAFIRALELGPAHLIGHSAGANIALFMARDHPKLVRSIILGEPVIEAMLARSPEAASVLPPVFFQEASQAFQRGDDEGGLRILADNIIGRAGAYDETPPRMRRMLSDNVRLGKAQLADPRPQPPFSCEDAQRIKAPALLLEGERTTKLFRLASEELRKCMPASEGALLPNATHALQWENPTGFNEIVLKFLAKHAGTPGGR